MVDSTVAGYRASTALDRAEAGLVPFAFCATTSNL